MPAVRRNLPTRAMWRIHRWLYARSGGRVGTRFGKQRFVLLTTTGRKSGQPRSVALTCLKEDDTYYVVGSYAGEDRDPSWWLNLQADPRAIVRVGRETVAVRARELTGAERERMYQRFVEIDDAYAVYRTRTSRQIPVIALAPEG